MRRRETQARLQAAQAARLRSEQQARITEQQRKAAEASQAQDRRNQVLEMRRRQEYTVKKTDTAETIAERLGTTPQAIASQTKGALRAGQVQSYEVPAGYRKAEDVGIGKQANVQTANWYKNIVSDFANFIGNTLLPAWSPQATSIDPMRGEQMLSQGLANQLGAVSQFQDEQAQQESVFNPQGPFMDAFGPSSFTGPQDMYTYRTPPGSQVSAEALDRTRDMEIRQVLQDTTKAVSDAEWKHRMAVYSMRYTHQALAYAYATGDMSLRPNEITPFEWANLSEDQKFTVQEHLGYVYDPDKDLWVPQDLPEAEYGMGGFDYGDYSGGGGGGDYTPSRYTSSQRGFEQGGRVQQGGGRLTESFIPASHWRI